MADSTVGRRDFLRAGLAGAAVACAGAPAVAAIPKEKQITLLDGLPQRAFGKTGHTLPIFGHGGSAMIESDIDKYGLALTTVEERIKMVRYGYDQGIRYFDTARIYGESEGIMAEALHDVRDNVFLATKVMRFDAGEVRQSVEESLATLRTDYVDSMQIHGPVVERLGYDGCMPIFEELAKMREEGLIRFIGLTGHSRFDNMHALINSGNFDTLLIEFGYFKKGYNTRHSEKSVELRELCVARAHELGMGIVAMKVMSAMIFGHNAPKVVPGYDTAALQRLPAAAIKWVLNDARVQILNLGVSMQSDIDANIAIFRGDLKLANEDRMLLADFSAKAYENEYVQSLKVV